MTSQGKPVGGQQNVSSTKGSAQKSHSRARLLEMRSIRGAALGPPPRGARVPTLGDDTDRTVRAGAPPPDGAEERAAEAQRVESVARGPRGCGPDRRVRDRASRVPGAGQVYRMRAKTSKSKNNY